MDNTVLMVATIAALLALLVWVDSRLLADLARTPDRELRYFPRNVWALIIVLSFPVGPMLYLRFAKDFRRWK